MNIFLALVASLISNTEYLFSSESFPLMFYLQEDAIPPPAPLPTVSPVTVPTPVAPGPYVPTDQAFTGITVSCQAASQTVITFAEQQLEYFNTMLGSNLATGQAKIASARSRQQSFISLSAQPTILVQTPGLVFNELSNIAVAAAEAAALAMPHHALANPAVLAMKQKVTVLSLQQRTLTPLTLTDFSQSINDTLATAINAMIDAFKAYKKSNPSRPLPSRFSTQTSGANYTRKRAMGADGTPLAPGMCYHVIDGKCTRMEQTGSCPFPHDYTSKGTMWTAPAPSVSRQSQQLSSPRK